jgi:uncharacterized membrane protein
MSKLTLTFEVDSIEDAFKIECLIKAEALYFTIYDLLDHLRSEIKYNENLTSEQRETLEKLREELNNIRSNYNVTFEAI